MAQTVQDLDVALAAVQSAVTDVKADLVETKTEVSGANARLLAAIQLLKDQLAAITSQDLTSQVAAANAVIPVLQGISTDLQAITASERTL